MVCLKVLAYLCVPIITAYDHFPLLSIPAVSRACLTCREGDQPIYIGDRADLHDRVPPSADIDHINNMADKYNNLLERLSTTLPWKEADEAVSVVVCLPTESADTLQGSA